MKKLFGFIFGLIIIAGIMAGIGAGAYYWSGSLAKESFEKSMQMTTGDQAVTYTITKYNQGLFDSTANAQVTLDPTKLNSGLSNQAVPFDKPFTIELEHTIYHGPFAFKAPNFDPAKPVAAYIKTKINTGANKDLKPLITQLWKDNPLKINSSVSFSGLVETTIEIAPIDFTSPTNMKVKWTGAKSIVSHDTSTNSFTSAIDAGGVSIEEDDNFALINGIKGKASGSFEAGNFMNSKAGYSVDSIMLEANTSSPDKMIKGNLNQLSVKAGNDIKAKELTSFINISAKDAEFNGDKYGPAEFQLDVRKIDAEAVKALQKDLEAAKAEVAKQGLPPEAAMFMAQQKLMETLPKLLKLGPEIEISKLELNTPQGKVEGYSKISLDLGDKQVPANPMELIPMIAINTKISAPAKLVEMILAVDAKKDIKRDLSMSGEIATPEQIEEMAMNKVNAQIEAVTAQNAITRSGDNLIGNYRLKQGVLNLNGMEIPIEQLIGMMMQGQPPK